MIWFTADHHFFHRNIIRHASRPFTSLEEMHAEMIRRWNALVQPRDIVYHLGDLSIAPWKHTRSIVEQLRGRISLVPGNHDKRWIKGFRKERPPKEFPLQGILDSIHVLKIPRGPILCLCHYPMLSWPKSHYGTLHLHGHSHNTRPVVEESGDTQLPPGQRRGRRINVSLECWAYAPVSLDELWNARKGAA